MLCSYYEADFDGLKTELTFCIQDENIVGISFGYLNRGTDTGDADAGDDAGVSVAEAARRQMLEYAAGRRRSFDLPIKFSGTEFQMKVWEALMQIPYGETVSYQDIARTAGNPAACRAAGGALHRNPIPIIVPCHRVIGVNGSLTGFGGGLPLKKKLLQIEQQANALLHTR
ncbi:MAG: methylated-DNA--[protein]-cysteine S-methyltransferase [Spirochaetaceae bacterium]|jgi:methylated-DNA-[protein]-cysteine S-methyltransferase|nr:methylated-DNA--[protein]-cysteine S-methyltransferase [Spirochaetaceae bacterium]